MRALYPSTFPVLTLGRASHSCCPWKSRKRRVPTIPHFGSSSRRITGVCSSTSPQGSKAAGYSTTIDTIRQREYPHMSNGAYLDHGGATIYARSTVEAFSSNMISNLYGNPHSANDPARASGDMVDRVRDEALAFLGADPRHFDLVFVANATAGIKLVADAFRDLAEKSRRRSFWFGYHRDAHTSLVGVRELTHGDSHCFASDGDVEQWVDDPLLASSYVNRAQPTGLGLFAYPGQSNMTGRRLPLSWTKRLRRSAPLQNTYSLLDAAALAMTNSMSRVFSDPNAAPDFTCLSFYKIFGFPDLGALVVRKDSGHILTLRKYFGGGTVTMVSTLGGTWHRSKGHETSVSKLGAAPATYSIHDGLEDGTLPFHNILALGEAIKVHMQLYGSMDNISRHTTRLSKQLAHRLASLRHRNGTPVCRIYSDVDDFGDPQRQGAVVAFNIVRSDGSFVPYSDVEKLANEKRVYIRSGGICCPGGLFAALQYEPWELERARSAGHHCGSDGHTLVHQLPTGVVRASLGAMSTDGDVNALITFLKEVFVEETGAEIDDSSLEPSEEERVRLSCLGVAG